MVSKSERKRLESVAAEYRTQGYDVKLQSGPGDLPDFLSGFEPDLVASGKGETIVVAVKSRWDLAEPAPVFAIQSALSDRPGWRFELIIDGTVPEYAQTINPTQIRASLEEALDLQEGEHSAAALLLLWSATEGALRFLADRENVEMESLDPGYVITQLYTLGLLGLQQYRTLDDAMRLRNRAAHGFQVSVTPQDLTGLVSLLNDLLNEVEVQAA